MDENSIERFVVAFEQISDALRGLHEEARKAGIRYWPEPGKQKEAVVSHVPTEEDRIRERQGAGDNRPINQWLTDLGDPEEEAGIVGERSRQWIIDHPPEENKKTEVSDAGSQIGSTGKQDTPSLEAAEGKA
jgi:hypothetical protein